MANRKITILFRMLGIDPRAIFALRYYPRYIREAFAFKSRGGKITHRYPILIDYTDQAGSARGHYFHQDLLVAKYVFENNPVRHIDVGSRIDGFVAHVAAFRELEVLDVRDLSNVGHANIKFLKANMMIDNKNRHSIADSISCLHAIEHFGLGRYGDPIDPVGHISGFANIVSMLKVGGLLYISFPIGTANEVHFNAHRVFHPSDIFNWGESLQRLRLKNFDYVDDRGELMSGFHDVPNDICVSYGCGIYTFQKISD